MLKNTNHQKDKEVPRNHLNARIVQEIVQETDPGRQNDKGSYQGRVIAQNNDRDLEIAQDNDHDQKIVKGRDHDQEIVRDKDRVQKKPIDVKEVDLETDRKDHLRQGNDHRHVKVLRTTKMLINLQD